MNSTEVSSTGCAAAGDVAGAEREFNVADLQDFVVIAAGRAGRGFAGAAQNGANARHQFARIERLGEIIVGADLQSQDAIDGLAAGGEQQNRHGGLVTQRLEQLESGAAGQHHIENDQLVVIGEGGGQSGVMVVGGIDVKALGLEKSLQQIDERVVVVDDEQLVHWIHCAFSSARLR